MYLYSRLLNILKQKTNNSKKHSNLVRNGHCLVLPAPHPNEGSLGLQSPLDHDSDALFHLPLSLLEVISQCPNYWRERKVSPYVGREPKKEFCYTQSSGTQFIVFEEGGDS